MKPNPADNAAKQTGTPTTPATKSLKRDLIITPTTDAEKQASKRTATGKNQSNMKDFFNNNDKTTGEHKTTTTTASTTAKTTTTPSPTKSPKATSNKGTTVNKNNSKNSGRNSDKNHTKNRTIIVHKTTTKTSIAVEENSNNNSNYNNNNSNNNNSNTNNRFNELVADTDEDKEDELELKQNRQRDDESTNIDNDSDAKNDHPLDSEDVWVRGTVHKYHNSHSSTKPTQILIFIPGGQVATFTGEKPKGEELRRGCPVLLKLTSDNTTVTLIKSETDASKFWLHPPTPAKLDLVSQTAGGLFAKKIGNPEGETDSTPKRFFSHTLRGQQPLGRSGANAVYYGALSDVTKPNRKGEVPKDQQYVNVIRIEPDLKAVQKDEMNILDPNLLKTLKCDLRLDFVLGAAKASTGLTENTASHDDYRGMVSQAATISRMEEVAIIIDEDPKNEHFSIATRNEARTVSEKAKRGKQLRTLIHPRYHRNGENTHHVYHEVCQSLDTDHKFRARTEHIYITFSAHTQTTMENVFNLNPSILTMMIDNKNNNYLKRVHLVDGTYYEGEWCSLTQGLNYKRSMNYRKYILLELSNEPVGTDIPHAVELEIGGSNQDQGSEASAASYTENNSHLVLTYRNSQRQEASQVRNTIDKITRDFNSTNSRSSNGEEWTTKLIEAPTSKHAEIIRKLNEADALVLAASNCEESAPVHTVTLFAKPKALSSDCALGIASLLLGTRNQAPAPAAPPQASISSPLTMMLRIPLGRKDTIYLIDKYRTKLKDDENFPFLAMLHSDRTGDQVNDLIWFSPKPEKSAPHEPSSASPAQNISSPPLEIEVAIDLGKYEPTHFNSEHVTIRELMRRFGISHQNATAARWAFGQFGSAIIVRAQANDFLARVGIHYTSKGIVANPVPYSAAEYPTAGKSVWALNAPTAPPARHHATESPVATPLAALIVISKQVLATFNSQSNPRQPKQQQQRQQRQSQQQHQQEQQPKNNNTTNETALTTESKRNDNDTGKQNTENEEKHDTQDTADEGMMDEASDREEEKEEKGDNDRNEFKDTRPHDTAAITNTTNDATMTTPTAANKTTDTQNTTTPTTPATISPTANITITDTTITDTATDNATATAETTDLAPHTTTRTPNPTRDETGNSDMTDPDLDELLNLTLEADEPPDSTNPRPTQPS